jgi:hypothetical protein
VSALTRGRAAQPYASAGAEVHVPVEAITDDALNKIVRGALVPYHPAALVRRRSRRVQCTDKLLGPTSHGVSLLWLLDTTGGGGSARADRGARRGARRGSCSLRPARRLSSRQSTYRSNPAPPPHRLGPASALHRTAPRPRAGAATKGRHGARAGEPAARALDTAGAIYWSCPPPAPSPAAARAGGVRALFLRAAVNGEALSLREAALRGRITNQNRMLAFVCEFSIPPALTDGANADALRARAGVSSEVRFESGFAKGVRARVTTDVHGNIRYSASLM